MVGLLVPVAAVVVLGHDQSANLVWMTLCVAAAWTALVAVPSVAGVAWLGLVAMPVVQLLRDSAEAGWFAWIVGTTFTSVACSFARRLRITNEQLRAAQAELAERSRAEERHRIAGEVHDVIGHALTVSLLHIEGARLALDDDLDEARASLAEAERLSRQSLEEVRATVGLMRSDGVTVPLPGAADLPELVESFRRAGARVDLQVSGDLAGIGPARGLAAYRIVQEALTNATRHAPGRPVTVVVDAAGPAVRLSVRDDGDARPHREPTDGNGLRGMRERAASVGGLVTAGPDAPGWLVSARLPR